MTADEEGLKACGAGQAVNLPSRFFGQTIQVGCALTSQVWHLRVQQIHSYLV